MRWLLLEPARAVADDEDGPLRDAIVAGLRRRGEVCARAAVEGQWRSAVAGRLLRRAAPDIVLTADPWWGLAARVWRPSAAVGLRLPPAPHLRTGVWSRWVLRHGADRLLVHDRAARRHCLHHLWLFEGRVRVVVPGIVPAAGAEPFPERRARRRAALGAEPNGLVTVCAGPLTAAQRPMDVLEAFLRLPAGPGDRLLFPGEGPQRAQLERRARRAGDGVEVRFGGAAGTRAAALEAADVLVHPGAAGGLPLDVLEAAAAGVLVVAASESGAAELIEDGRDGRIYPRGDIAALAALLREARDAPESARRIAAAGREAACTRFSADRMVADLRGIMTEAAVARQALRERGRRDAGGWRSRGEPSIDEGMRAAMSAAATRAAYAPADRAKVEIGGRRFILQRSRAQRLRRPAAAAVYRAAHRLSLLGLRVAPHPAVFWNRRSGAAVVVLADPVHLPPASDWFAAFPPGAPERRAFCRAFGRWLAALHAAGIVPRRIEPGSLRVCPETDDAPVPVLADLSHGRLRHYVRQARAAQNLRHIYHTFEPLAAPREMLAFLVSYRRARALRKRALRRLLSRTARRIPRAAGGLSAAARPSAE